MLMANGDLFMFSFIRNRIPTTIQMCQEDIHHLLTVSPLYMGI